MCMKIKIPVNIELFQLEEKEKYINFIYPFFLYKSI